MLVTDAMPTVGTNTDTYVLGGVTVTCRGGRCETPDGVLAGSALDMGGAVRNCVRLLGMTLDEAARMASSYPADFLGVATSRGRIAAGQRADFVQVDEDLAVRRTWIAATASES